MKNKELEQQYSLPEGFWSLLGLILKNIPKMFFRRLPIMIFFGVVAWALHTYLLVVINEGFTGGPLRGIISGEIIPSVSVMTIWTFGSMLLTGLLSLLFGKSSGYSVKEQYFAVKNYFNESRKDAIAVALGGFGIALTFGTIINAHASLFVAVSVAVLITSKSSVVIALLFRSVWNSVFNIFRRNKATYYGLTSGYISLIALSLGFIANAIFTPDSAMVGIILLAISLFIMIGISTSTPTISLLIPILIIVGGSFFGFDLLWADDGGWREAGSNFDSWWKSEGAIIAILVGISPALGVILGILIQQVLKDMANNLPIDTGRLDVESSIDVNKQEIKSQDEEYQETSLADNFEWRHPNTNEIPVKYDETKYIGGEEGDFFFEGEWLDQSEVTKRLAAAWENQAQEWRDIRDGQKRWADEQDQVRIEKLKDDHFILDEKNGELIRDPNYKPPKSVSEEYFDRLEYIRNISHKLSLDQQNTVDRILKNNVYGENGEDFTIENIRDSDIETLSKLVNATNNLVYGEEAYKGAKAQEDSIYQDNMVRRLDNLVTSGKMAAAYLEELTPVGKITNGAISSFIYDGIANRDQKLEVVLEIASKGAFITFAGGRLNNYAGNGPIGETLVGGLGNAAETLWKGGTREDAEAAEKFGTGAAFTLAIAKLIAKSRGL